MLPPRGSNFLQMKLDTCTRMSSSIKYSIKIKQKLNEIVTKNAKRQGGPVRSGCYLAGQPAKQSQGRGEKVRRAGLGLPSPPPAPPARPPASLSGPVPSLHPPARSPDSNPPPPPPHHSSSPPAPPIHSSPPPSRGLVSIRKESPPAGRPPPDSAPSSPALDRGAFWNPSRRLSRPERSNSVGFLLPSRSTAGGARPESGAEGVDATRRWIAEPSGVTRATARARPLRPRPRRRRPCPGRPRPRWGAPRTTSASARRCCRGAPRAARRARHTGGPSGGCSGRTPTGRSSPRSWNSSLVIQATRMMTTWILAYVQSCKYLDAESPVHPAQVESTSV